MRIYSCTIRAYVRTCLSRSGMSICTHVRTCTLRNSCVMCTDAQGCLAMEDREQWRFLTMEDAEDSTAGPPQRTCFAELTAERN